MQTFFKNLSIRFWMVLWISFLFVFLMIIFSVSYSRARELRQAFDDMKEESDEMRVVFDTAFAVNQVDVFMHNRSSLNFDQSQKKQFEELSRIALSNINGLKAYSKNLPNEIEVFGEIKNSYLLFDKYTREIFDALQKKSFDSEEINALIEKADIALHESAVHMGVWLDFSKKEIMETELEVTSVQKGLIVFSIYLIFLVFVVSSALAIFLFLTIGRSINKMIVASQAISKGDLSVRINIDSKNEIGEVATAFNKMAVELEMAKKDDEQHEAELEKKMKQLEIMNKAMVGRELDMVELKKKIKELETLKR